MSDLFSLSDGPCPELVLLVDDLNLDFGAFLML